MMALSTRRLLGNVAMVMGLLVALLSIVRPVNAAGTTIQSDTPGGLALAISQVLVADGAAQNVLVVPEDDLVLLAAAGAAAAALPPPVSVLLSTRGSLDSATAAELTRVSNALTVAYVLGDSVVAAAIEARGLIVNLVTGDDTTALAVSLAEQTFGAAGGTSQRLLVTSRLALQAAGLAGVHGANLGIPVVPILGDYTGDVFLREVIVVSPPRDVTDANVAGQPGDPAITRVGGGTLDADAQALAALLASEPRDGDLADRAGLAAVVVDGEERHPAPVLLAAVVAAHYAQNGFDAPLRVLSASDPLPTDVAEATRLRLTSGVTEREPAPSPLPATGGGIAIGALLVAAGAVTRRAGRPN